MTSAGDNWAIVYFVSFPAARYAHIFGSCHCYNNERRNTSLCNFRNEPLTLRFYVCSSSVLTYRLNHLKQSRRHKFFPRSCFFSLNFIPETQEPINIKRNSNIRFLFVPFVWAISSSTSPYKLRSADCWRDIFSSILGIVREARPFTVVRWKKLWTFMVCIWLMLCGCVALSRMLIGIEVLQGDL